MIAVISLACVLQTGSRTPPPPLPKAAKAVLEGARQQLVKPARYDASYKTLSYPNGDVAPDRGACSDVIIRALRHAGYDLQKLVHEDAKRNKYPFIQKLDSNIDHRRVRNLIVYFRRHGLELELGSQKWRGGDFVTWKLPGGQDHIGVVTDQKGPSGNLMVIHNLGLVAEEDILKSWKVVGHYRFPKS